VSQFVEALRHKAEGRGSHPHWCHWLNTSTSGRTMALGSIKPLTEMSTRGVSSGAKDGRCVGLKMSHLYANRLEIPAASNTWRPPTGYANARTAIPFYVYVDHKIFTLRITLRKVATFFSSSSFTVGPVGLPTVGTAAYRLIVPPCFGSHLSPPGALRTQMARETSGREWENYGREMAEWI
jgi:hypothetical protein